MIAMQTSNSAQRDKMQGLVPLSKVAKAAIIDQWGDVGKHYELNMHWAARSYHELMQQYLHLKSKMVKRKILLNVNANTKTATLPCDVEDVLFVAGICDGKKFPLSMNGALIDSESIEFEEDKCSECGQNRNICNELQVTETVNAITINNVVYDETIVKKLYPNGDYYIETTTPYWNINDEVIEYIKDKKFVTNLDLLPCGCLSTTQENLNTLQIHCPDTFFCHFCSCDNTLRGRQGGFNVFEETGLLQLDFSYRYTKVYLEYNSFIKKMNGQWYVPQVAFEMLVEMVKFKNIDGKSNVSRFDKDWRQRQIDKARGNMERIIFRFNISTLLELLRETPKFDINNNWYTCYNRNVALTASAPIVATCAATSSISSAPSSVITIGDIIFKRRKFTVQPAGAPINDGDRTYVIKTTDTGDAITGIPETNIKTGSVNVVVNSQTLIEDYADQLSFTVVYTAAATTITFNDDLLSYDKVLISYAKSV